MFVRILITGCEGTRTGGTATAAAQVVDSRGSAVGGTFQISFLNLLHKDMLAPHRKGRCVGLAADFSRVQIGFGFFLLRRLHILRRRRFLRLRGHGGGVTGVFRQGVVDEAKHSAGKAHRSKQDHGQNRQKDPQTRQPSQLFTCHSK